VFLRTQWWLGVYQAHCLLDILAFPKNLGWMLVGVVDFLDTHWWQVDNTSLVAPVGTVG
jgi:hypothetical protein